MINTLKTSWYEPITDKRVVADAFMRLLICASVAGVLIFSLMNLESMVRVTRSLCNTFWGTVFLTTGELLLVINIASFIWRVFLVWRYKPAPMCSHRKLPKCTVIVPAYNEGRHVMATLESLAASDYPAHKLQIIAVDDGSADDTWYWIRTAAKKLKGKILPLKHAVNKGKRYALHTGFQQSTGDIVITVDSDSIVEPQTLRRLVSPFVHDPEVGAVAGNVRVLNRHEGIIPRMMDVVFFYSFDFTRASQSMVNTVFCTPGALSAYRTNLVKKVMDEWVAQKFWGEPANIGEDRAITNMILQQGYHVRFQQDAVVYTNIPSKFKGLCRMFLRWERSNIRENIMMSGFAFRKFREGSMLGARINLLLSWLEMTVSQFFLGVTMWYLVQFPIPVTINILIGTAVSSAVTMAFYFWKYKSADALLAFVYGIFWFVGLSWITPYSWLTINNSGWMTRQISVPKFQPPQTATLPQGLILETVPVKG